MESEEVTRQLRELCARVLSVPEETVIPQARLVADLAADSLDFAELDVAVQDMFGVTLDADAVKRAATFGGVADLVVARLAARAPEVA
ncbi:acyl carrier protein [Streptomyces sp. NPDC048275]|uniref:acyl carrier protein n=1 Tax=Streptomyces sp. NPDC048275 TaxID=3155629 RepID=UPI0033D3257F